MVDGPTYFHQMFARTTKYSVELEVKAFGLENKTDLGTLDLQL